MDHQETPYFVTLPDRALINIKGADAYAFLQNLISNDMDMLKSQPMIYAHLLTPQGKFLFDFFISRTEEGYLLECEGRERADALLKKLTTYKLRSKIDLSITNPCPVYIIFGTYQPPDPRHPALGHRSLDKPENMEERPFEFWDRLRITCGVPDGSRDMVIEKSTLIESSMDIFHAISFTKGCYIGQEITARMHNRGLAKKHLIAVTFTGSPPAPDSDIITSAGHLVGEMRSSCGNVGMALIKDEALASLITENIKPLQAHKNNKVLPEAEV